MIAAIVIASIVVLYFGLCSYGARRAMEIPRQPLVHSPASVGLDWEDVSFPGRDGTVVLKGWYLRGGGKHAIIIVNGGFQNRVDENSDTLGLTAALVKKGYDVLLFDLRGRGESTGRGREFSYIDSDIGGAMDYLVGRGYSTDAICVLGFCSGAAQSCIFASRNDPGAVILDGCFPNISTMLVREVVATGPPEFLVRIFIPGLLVMTKLLYRYDVVNPIDVVAGIRCNVLFIHEEGDEFTSWEETRRLYEASGNPESELWQITGTGHSQGSRTQMDAYVERVHGFLSVKSRAAARGRRKER